MVKTFFFQVKEKCRRIKQKQKWLMSRMMIAFFIPKATVTMAIMSINK